MKNTRLNSHFSQPRLGAALLAAVLAATSSAYAADILKLSTGGLANTAGWDGGVLPGSSNVGLFDGTTVTSGGGASFDASGSASSLTFGGLKFTGIQGNVTFTNVATVTVGASGLDMSAATADVTFSGGTYRFGASGTLNVGSGRTLTIQNTGTNASSTITLSGGGTLITNGTFTGTNRLSLLVANGTIAGTGTYRGNNTNTGYAVRVQTGSFVSAGNGGVGTLTFDSAGTGQTLLDMQSGSGFKFDLGTGGSFVTPGTSDLLMITNAAAADVVFSNNTIDFLGTGSVGVFKLFDTSFDATTWSGLTISSSVITGGLTVSNLANGLTGTLYLGDGAGFGDAGDIYLQVTSAVPEPASFAALAGLATLGLAASRRRRRA